MNVLSLFDGISCGMVALERAGISVENYYAFEIDKYAIKISQANYPKIQQLGDITKWREWSIPFSKIGLIMAGFPCQSWSVAGKQKGTDDPRGALVHDLIDIWNECKKHNPDVKFLFENVKMKKTHLDYVNRLFGVEPVCINSELVSAQNRVRYYWTNIGNATQPEDKGILLKDIIESVDVGKGQMLVEDRPCTSRGYTLNGMCHQSAMADDIKGHDCIRRVYSPSGKAPTLNACTGGNREAKVQLTESTYRKLTPLECERLQTLPEGYTDHVSNSQRYKAIGNGWTVDVIVHILKGMGL